jgi:hypothetical protein
MEEFDRHCLLTLMMAANYQGEVSRRIEQRFLDCASRQLRRSEVEKQKGRLARLGMTVFAVAAKLVDGADVDDRGNWVRKIPVAQRGGSRESWDSWHSVRGLHIL